MRYFDLYFALKSEKYQLRACDESVSKIRTMVSSDISEKQIVRFLRTLEKKWAESSRWSSRFEKLNSEWLNSEIVIEIPLDSSSSLSRGRPKIDFVDSSARSKRRKISVLSIEESTSQLLGAFIKSAKSESYDLSPHSFRNLSIIAKKTKSDISFSPAKALQIMFDGKLSVSTYKLLKKQLKNLEQISIQIIETF